MRKRELIYHLPRSIVVILTLVLYNISKDIIFLVRGLASSCIFVDYNYWNYSVGCCRPCAVAVGAVDGVAVVEHGPDGGTTQVPHHCCYFRHYYRRRYYPPA